MNAREVIKRLLQLSNDCPYQERKTALHWAWKQILSNYIMMDASVSEKGNGKSVIVVHKTFDSMLMMISQINKIQNSFSSCNLKVFGNLHLIGVPYRILQSYLDQWFEREQANCLLNAMQQGFVAGQLWWIWVNSTDQSSCLGKVASFVQQSWWSQGQASSDKEHGWHFRLGDCFLEGSLL